MNPKHTKKTNNVNKYIFDARLCITTLLLLELELLRELLRELIRELLRELLIDVLSRLFDILSDIIL